MKLTPIIRIFFSKPDVPMCNPKKPVVQKFWANKIDSRLDIETRLKCLNINIPSALSIAITFPWKQLIDTLFNAWKKARSSNVKFLCELEDVKKDTITNTGKSKRRRPTRTLNVNQAHETTRKLKCKTEHEGSIPNAAKPNMPTCKTRAVESESSPTCCTSMKCQESRRVHWVSPTDWLITKNLFRKCCTQ